MTINHVRTFLAIVVTGSFSEAAESLYMTQATVSKQIHALEKELGVQLFDRSHRRPELTEAGLTFLPYAQTFQDTYNAMTEKLHSLSAPCNNNLSIASIPVMAQYGIISLINAFRNNQPGFHVAIEERESCDIPSAIEAQQYEMAFYRAEWLDHKKYQHIKLFEDRMYALLPSSHPLAGRASISLRDLQQDVFLLLGRHTDLYDFCINCCRQYANFTPRVGYTGTRMENIVEMVSEGMGVSMLMEKPARYILKQHSVSLVPLQETITTNISLIRLRNRPLSSAGNAFWGYMRKRFSQM